MLPVSLRERDSVPHGLLGRLLEPQVDGQAQGRRLVLLRHLERAGDPAQRVDAHLRRDEARVEDRVVELLDPGLADDLARPHVRVARGAELRLADLAQQSEELAAERALRVRARGLGEHLEAGEGLRPLLQEDGEVAARTGQDDRRRERRPDDRAPDPLDEGLHRRPGDLRELLERGTAVAGRAPDPVRVGAAERRGVGGDHEAGGHPREQLAVSVDDHASRAAQVDGAERLRVRLRRVLRAVQHLDRPDAQQEQRERDGDDHGQPADPDEEPGAAEVGRIRPRVGLKTTPARQLARELHPAARVGCGDGQGFSGGVVCGGPPG